jgi:outer membrane protein
MKSFVPGLLLMLAWISSVNAQPVLTLDRCLLLARQHNLRLRVTENASHAAALSRDELMTTRLPQFQFEASALYAPSSGHFGYDPLITNSGQFAGQIVGRQSLYDGGIRNLRVDQIGVDIDLRGREARATQRDLTYSVKQAFIEALRAEQEIQLQSESVSQLASYLERVKQLSIAGNASTTDILKTQVQLSSAEISLYKSRESYSAAKYALSELIGTAIDTSFTVTGSLDDAASPSIDSLSSGSGDSLENVELSMAALTIQRNKLDLELTRHELSPTVSLVGDAGLLTSRDNLRLPYDQRGGILGYSVGLVFELRFFNWGATDLRVQQRESAGKTLELQSELLRRSIISESKKIRLSLIESRRRLIMLRENINASEENFLLTKSKYLAGGTLSLEVLSAQQLLTDSRLLELQTAADICILSARLEQLLTH